MTDDINDSPETPQTKPAAKPAKKTTVGLVDGKQTPVYEAQVTVVLVTDRQEYPPGTILDLSHLSQEAIRKKLDQKQFITASGEPANVPAATAEPCKNC